MVARRAAAVVRADLARDEHGHDLLRAVAAVVVVRGVARGDGRVKRRGDRAADVERGGRREARRIDLDVLVVRHAAREQHAARVQPIEEVTDPRE